MKAVATNVDPNGRHAQSMQGWGMGSYATSCFDGKSRSDMRQCSVAVFVLLGLQVIG